MRPQQIMAAFGIFIVGTLLCCLASGRWLLNGEQDIINTLASFNTVQDWVGVRGPVDWFNALVSAFTWRYPFLSSPWATFIKIPLWIISLGVIWGIIEIMIQLVQGAISGIRSLLGVGG